MASMAAIGSLNVPRSASSRSSFVGRKSVPRSLSFSASQLCGDKIPTDSVLLAPKIGRSPVIVTPKAVSDSQNSQTCLDPDASRSVLGIILGGGAGTRLYPLTKKRAKPAVPLGANYRLIDIPVSNCLNSNVSKIYVLTQFNSASLNRHLSRAYASNMGGYKNEGFVEVLAAQQSPENPNWFQGTADAVRQYLWLFEEHNVLEFLVLAGDHLYRMDYEKFIQAHRETDADITVAALPMDEARATAFGLMKIDEEGRIIEFAEKPKGEQLILQFWVLMTREQKKCLILLAWVYMLLAKM
ncbi:Glucose-1-phosphate adenylyltransferase small subunit, chloroplastic [Glycine max]|nr:Glucose-1-phosphate adenylyltransferase small subunit, chloroplastic [Glycine max]